MRTFATQHESNTPAYFRTVARLGIQAAEALDHAHAQGVIHRDIKPANLMLDGEGKLWITDFGLARIEADAGMTMTGDLLGTLRYMSPEQASGKQILDQRSDIYSLGITLYEMLTLRPAFDGEGQQKMLRQVIEDDPPPPRQINSAIPTDLETIVLKASSKSPADRYTSAQHLADDLRRYLEHKPILARRPSLVERAGKWSRRHQAVVWSGVAVLLLAVLALATSTAMILDAQSETQAAYDGEAEQRRLAEQRFDDEKRARIEVERQRKLADSRREATAENFLMMMRTSGFFSDRFLLDEVFNDDLPIREFNAYKSSVENHYKIIEKLKTLLADFPNDPDVTFDLATTHAALGICLAHLGETDKAIAEIEWAFALVDEANRYPPTRTAYGKMYLHGRLVEILGRLFKRTNQLEKAWGYSVPLCLTFGPGGDLFVGSRALHCVLQFDVRTCRYVRVFAEGGGLNSPNGLTFGPDGHLYVCSEWGDSILRYDGATGEFMDAFVANIRHPVGLVFGPDGNLYVNSWFTHQVLRYNGTTGEFMSIFVQPESGGLRNPEALAFGPDGNLFIASAGTDAVLRFDGESGRFIGTFASRAGLHPSGLTFGPNNRLYVSSGNIVPGGSGSLSCFDATTGASVWSHGRGSNYTSVALGPGGDLYITHNHPGGVMQFNGETGELTGSLLVQTDAREKSK